MRANGIAMKAEEEFAMKAEEGLAMKAQGACDER